METKKLYRTKREIIGAFGKWILRHYPHWEYQEKMFFPAIKEIESCCDTWEDQKSEVLGINDLGDFVQSVIDVCPLVRAYNDSRYESDNPDYKKPQCVLVDRYHELKPEHDFIDLDALKRNVIGELLD